MRTLRCAGHRDPLDSCASESGLAGRGDAPASMRAAYRNANKNGCKLQLFPASRQGGRIHCNPRGGSMLSADLAVSADGDGARSERDGDDRPVDGSVDRGSPGGQPGVPRGSVFVLRGEHRESNARASSASARAPTACWSWPPSATECRKARSVASCAWTRVTSSGLSMSSPGGAWSVGSRTCATAASLSSARPRRARARRARRQPHCPTRI